MKQRLLQTLSSPKIMLLVAVILVTFPEFFIHHHEHFAEQGITVDASFGFYFWFSLAAGIMMVIGARILGVFLRRRDNYYHE